MLTAVQPRIKESMNAKSAGLLLLLVAAFSLLHAEEKVHVLRPGETLYGLARTYRVSLETLLTHNEIRDPTALPVGSKIRIPATYVVREGEYVFSIAQELGFDWQELLRANGLGRDDVVRPGDVLILPRTPTIARQSPGAAPVAATPQTSERLPATRDGSNGRSPVTTEPATVLWPHPGARATWEGRFPGVVMQGRTGDEIRSVTEGVVSFAGPFTSFGKIVLVRSEGGYLYGYAGAESLTVQAGDPVEIGSLLGSVGYSPAFDAVKVLFTVWYRNRYIDPERAPRG